MEAIISKYETGILFYRKIIVLSSKELKISGICTTSKEANLEKRSKTAFWVSPDQRSSFAWREGFLQLTPEYFSASMVWAHVMQHRNKILYTSKNPTSKQKSNLPLLTATTSAGCSSLWRAVKKWCGESASKRRVLIWLAKTNASLLAQTLLYFKNGGNINFFLKCLSSVHKSLPNEMRGLRDNFNSICNHDTFYFKPLSCHQLLD